MSKKFIIAQLIILLGYLLTAAAMYWGPSHAEERKHQLEQERLAQHAHQVVRLRN